MRVSWLLGDVHAKNTEVLFCCIWARSRLCGIKVRNSKKFVFPKGTFYFTVIMTQWNSEKANKEINSLCTQYLERGTMGQLWMSRKYWKEKFINLIAYRILDYFKTTYWKLRTNVCQSSKLLHTWKRNFCMAWW